MPVRTHHYAGIARYADLFVYINHAPVILLQSPGNAGVYTGSVGTVLAGIQPGLILVKNQISPGPGSTSFVSFQYVAVIAVVPGGTVNTT